MEFALGYFQNLMASVIGVVPIGYAFGAGMMSTVNPCGFALLPGYLSIYLGIDVQGEVGTGVFFRAFKSLVISLAVTTGFVFLFSLVGLVIVSGGRFITYILPWASLLVGVATLTLGLWLLASGRSFYVGFMARVSESIGSRFLNRYKVKSRYMGVPQFFIFGICYGIASLSCTLPIFLLVVGSSVVSEGYVNGFLQFISYGLGMGFVITVLTLGIALFKGVLTGYVRRIIPYLQVSSALLVSGSGAFIIYYWISTGNF